MGKIKGDQTPPSAYTGIADQFAWKEAFLMKIVVVKSPKALRGLLMSLFKLK